MIHPQVPLRIPCDDLTYLDIQRLVPNGPHQCITRLVWRALPSSLFWVTGIPTARTDFPYTASPKLFYNFGRIPSSFDYYELCWLPSPLELGSPWVTYNSVSFIHVKYLLLTSIYHRPVVDVVGIISCEILAEFCLTPSSVSITWERLRCWLNHSSALLVEK